MAMRKTLARIIRDLTPSDSAVRYPLSDETVADIKVCFDLISTRERELAELAGVAQEQPRFIDEAKPSQVIPMSTLKPRKS